MVYTFNTNKHVVYTFNTNNTWDIRLIQITRGIYV